MQDDASLLQQYAETRSDEAFAELVRRHLNLVYSAALRQVAGDTHLAQDVAQMVFTDLARKAATLAGCPVLAGWLHTSTHYAAAKAVRTEQRRRAREQEAHTMHELSHESTHDAEWAQMRPVLDDAIRELSATDRDAILLRFFEGQAFAAIGTRFGLAENAARMRVERALEKLRGQLARRGISSTSAALATVLVSQAVIAAPATLATSVTTGALAAAGSTGAVVSFFQLMAITKTQVAVTGALLIAGGSMLVMQQKSEAALREEIAALNTRRFEMEQLRETNTRLASANTGEETLRAAAAELTSLRKEIADLRARVAAMPRTTRTPSRVATLQKSGTPAASSTNQTQSGDRMPMPKQRVAPKFPFAMREAGITGRAEVLVVIDANGNVQNPTINKSTHPEFEAPALEAVQQWKFDAGQKAGKPVNTRIVIPIIFGLNPGDPDWF